MLRLHGFNERGALMQWDRLPRWSNCSYIFSWSRLRDEVCPGLHLLYGITFSQDCKPVVYRELWSMHRDKNLPWQLSTAFLGPKLQILAQALEKGYGFTEQPPSSA